MVKKFILVVALLGVGGTAGYFLRGGAPSSNPATEKNVSGVASGASHGAGSSSFHDHDNGKRTSPAVASRADVETLIAQLQEIPSLSERGRRFNAIMKSWALSDGKAAFDYANSLADDTGYLKIEAMAAVAKVLADSDPKFLEKMINELPENASRQALVMALAGHWAEDDVRGALAWADKLPADRSKNNALALLRSRLAKEDPEQASKVLTELPAGFVRQNLVATIAAEWGLRDPASASKWMESLPDADKQVAIPLLAGSWAQANPVEAGNFIANLPGGETQNRAAMAVVANWASQNPQAAAAWAAGFPEDGLCELGVREAVNTWSHMDAQGSLAWAKQLPNAETRDVALKSYAESVAYWAPEKTVEVVDLIEDPARREQSMEAIMRSWSELDPQAAQKWLSQLKVRDGLRNRLQAVLSAN